MAMVIRNVQFFDERSKNMVEKILVMRSLRIISKL